MKILFPIIFCLNFLPFDIHAQSVWTDPTLLGVLEESLSYIDAGGENNLDQIGVQAYFSRNFNKTAFDKLYLETAEYGWDTVIYHYLNALYFLNKPDLQTARRECYEAGRAYSATTSANRNVLSRYGLPFERINHLREFIDLGEHRTNKSLGFDGEKEVKGYTGFSDEKQSTVPSFPWPPPQATTDCVLPKQLFANAATLGDVDSKISYALSNCGYFEKSYFKVPGGFAIVTRIEQFNDDGTCKPGSDRWNVSLKPSRFHISDYFRALFWGREGRYRIIVFIVTAEVFHEGTNTPREAEAHHINLDPFFEDGSRAEIELKADEFFGFALARLGATQEQALTSAAGFSANGSRTHPGRRDREDAIRRGWRKGGGGGGGQVDSDGDGILDLQDACPTEFGSRKAKGCPDYDDDGIPNMNDDCPCEAGTAQHRGCPEPVVTDSDGDGVPDVSDKCQFTKGLARFEGCPDTDGDNVPDRLDNCPNVKGLASNNGCPPVIENTTPAASAGKGNASIYPAGFEYLPDLMLPISAGTFTMGSNEYVDEKPPHTVRVGDFYLGKYEVTVKEFRAFINDSGYKTDAEKEGWSYYWDGDSWEKKNGVYWKHDAQGNLRSASDYDHPVIHVSWNDATEYCKWLSKKTGKTYRLPTEAEWEYAAGNGSKHTKYSWGNGSPSGKNGGNVAGEAGAKKFNWTRNETNIFMNYNDGYEATAPVGQFNPNDFGLFDMSGNVWEWCSDWYDSGYYKQFEGKTADNPKGPTTGTARVVRGGSWYTDPANCRSAGRGSDVPGLRLSRIGFRLVLVLVP